MKIFITIGTQEPFDRLIKVMDKIAFELKNKDLIIEAQTSNSSYIAENIKTYDFISPLQFELKVKEADIIISHAGMGTIISAMTVNKPIIVMPRLAKLGEHRNDHQLATVKAFENLNYIYVAYTEMQLMDLVNTAIKNKQLPPLHQIGKYASNTLLDAVKDFIQSND